MICFIKESPLDVLLYHPITKILAERKIDHIVFEVKEQSTIEIIQFFMQHPTIETVVNYGGSHRKMIIASLCKEYNRKFVNLHGEERRIELDTTGFLGTIAALATHNLVSSDASRGFLLHEGIQTPIGIFECPITHLCRKSEDRKNLDVVFVSEGGNYKREIANLEKARISYELFDFSKEQPKNWLGVYSAIRSAKHVVSDSFVLDKPTRFLNKHFFYLGLEVLNHDNLGVSTHLVSKNLDLTDYLKQKWNVLPDINQRHGLNSLLRLL